MEKKIIIPPHTQIPNCFIDRMSEYNGAAVKIFIAICRKTLGWHKISDKISYSQITETTGITKRRIRENLSLLIKNKWIVQSGNMKTGYSYDLAVDKMTTDKIKDCGQNDHRSVDKMTTVGPKTVVKMSTTKERLKEKRNIMSGNDKIPYQKIILHLNEKAKSHFKDTSRNTRNKISARFNEGFTEDDFYRVIDAKCEQWLGDEKMVRYLRPETLFCAGHFESYLNEHPAAVQTKTKKFVPEVYPKCPECGKEYIGTSCQKCGWSG